MDKLKATGSLENCLAVCDVSGSMAGLPLEVAVSLSLVIAELTKPPFSGLVCTFSRKPVLHVIKGQTLAEKVWNISKMGWEVNTDFQAVFSRTTCVSLRKRPFHLQGFYLGNSNLGLSFPNEAAGLRSDPVTMRNLEITPKNTFIEGPPGF